MRADIHDGPEQPLQSEAGYIDARPQRRQIDEILLRRTAGPYKRVSQRQKIMSAATAAFLGSGRRMRATVAPPTTVTRACQLVSELAPIADAGADDHGICNGPTTD